jgi:hypothetical protein
METRVPSIKFRFTQSRKDEEDLMTPINSVGNSLGTNAMSSGRSAGPVKAFDKELTSYLQEQGLSDDQQASIKGELRQAIQSTLTSGSRPEPGKLKSTIQGVLDKHGVDGKAFIDKIPTPTSGAIGVGNIGETSKDDNLSELLELLGEQVENSRQASRQSQSQDSPNQQSATPSVEKLDVQA